MSQISLKHEKDRIIFGNWIAKNLGKGVYALEYRLTDDKCLVLDADENIIINFKGWRICRIDFASNDATSKDLTVYVVPNATDLKYPPRIINEAGNIETDMVFRFEEEYTYGLGDAIRIYCDGTASKKLYVRITIQRTK